MGQYEIGVFEFVVGTGVVTEDDVRDYQGQGLVKVNHLDAVNAQDGDIGILRSCNKSEAFPIIADVESLPTLPARQ